MKSRSIPLLSKTFTSTNQAMAEAFEVLSDEEKRGNYDTFGMDGQGTSGEKRQKKKNNEKRSGVFGDFVDEEEFQVRYWRRRKKKKKKMKIKIKRKRKRLKKEKESD